ncbi:TIM-barrel domain-containing protein [Actinomyces slackii]|uniref:Alpha-xylosidase n=1 Tax=Actinomyces slackii TaxID=52774 RepID=A0A3S4SG74_9ACTO|nr:TIM-barrel domain-containing protein [Actinomyces slackii]VEG75282.1 Alpha-xylosidase [Actinomyces slackii]
MIECTQGEHHVELRYRHDVIRIESWGRDAIRVRAGRHRIAEEDHGALGTPPLREAMTLDALPEGTEATIGLGAISVRAVLDPGSGNPRLMLSFLRDGREILTEAAEHFWWPGPRSISRGPDGSQIRQSFVSDPSERLYGLGQHSHGRLDLKGLVVDLIQRNGEVSIPFLLSSRGYGLLWNNPAVGRVELAADRTRWTGHGTEQIDYWLCLAPTPAGILGSYADAVGHAPQLPEWATGFWQSRLRYTSQEEILQVARRYRDEGLPLSVIVTDFLHWPAMGDYCFDPEEYPDPDGMLRELEAMGTRLMVSVWPTVSPHSRNVEEMRAKGLLVATEAGVEYHQEFKDKGMDRPLPVSFYDPTNPAARSYLWQRIVEGYYDLGVRLWWLDACEPELSPGHPGNLSFYSGQGLAVSNTYPREHARAFWEGMTDRGERHTVLLCRSAWAGSARYGVAVWSGDIAPTWQALRAQIPAGMSIGIAGIPWWTSDIGGFHGGDPADPDYQELFIRWFEFGTFCPLFRLHGHREPREAVGAVSPGGPNEIWSYGPQAHRIAADHIRMRERLRPYIDSVMDQASATGLPAMRALLVDFPQDPRCWSVEDQFLLGPDLLVCPITEPGARQRQIYLPDGAQWRDPVDGAVYDGGTTITLPAPLERIPVLIRQGSELEI